MQGINLSVVVAVLVAIASAAAYMAGLQERMAMLEQRVQPLALIEAARDAAIAEIGTAGNDVLRFDRPELFGTGGEGRNSERLIRADAGACSLTRIAGDLNGNGEWARIRERGDGYLYLETKSRDRSGAGAWVYAEVSCLRFPTATPVVGTE